MPKPDRLSKNQALIHWNGLTPPARDIPIRPIPYKHEGTTYFSDGIRITGTRDFIDSILSRLTDLLQHEGPRTRIGINYQEATDRETGKPAGTWTCYIQVHNRGREAKIANAIFSSVYA